MSWLRRLLDWHNEMSGDEEYLNNVKTDILKDQVFVYTGDSRTHQINDKWELVGPAFTASQTESGWKIETLASAGGNKVVSSMYAEQ